MRKVILYLQERWVFDMKFTKKRKEQIKLYILEKIFKKDKNFKKSVAESHDISKSTVYRYIKELLDDGIIYKSDDFYKLTTELKYFSYDMKSVKDESDVFDNDILPLISNLPKNLKNIWCYAFTEMFNNVIDHSDSDRCFVIFSQNQIYTWIQIMDNGVGIYNKIQSCFKQKTINQVILDLFKGKLTTDPSRHSGEGIFFTSKIMDRFYAISNGYIFTHSNVTDYKECIDEKHPLSNSYKDKDGTTILMVLSNNSKKELVDIFNMYSNPDNGVTKTVIPMRFACDSGYPISRSQAKRLTVGIDIFEEVELDFLDVENIGQSFSDELFRVFANKHPEIKLIPINANENILKMIEHVKSNKTLIRI